MHLFSTAILWGKTFAFSFYDCTFQVFALAMVSIGVAVATVTDLQFHFFGACVAVAWIIPSAVNKILWSNLQQQENWTALAYNTLTFSFFRILCVLFSFSSCFFSTLVSWIAHYCKNSFWGPGKIVQANVEDHTYYIILPVDDDAVTWSSWCPFLWLGPL